MIKKINYKVSFSEAVNHYCDVRITVSGSEKGILEFSMPVWSPGSYMVRDYSGKVHDAAAACNGPQKPGCRKINKNTWQVDSPGGDVSLSYRVYCNELTVRTSEVNYDHAFLNPVGVFMFVRGHEHLPCELEVDLPGHWKKISTGMNRKGKNKFTAVNYDVFADCPIEAGNQEILEFSIKNVPHRICISGRGDYDPARLIRDFKAISEEQIRFFGGKIPYSHYTYIINLVEKGGGGLEHLNSFAVLFQRQGFSDKKLYRKFLGLVSHEYFHLWNVKRIRPVALGPFDYDKENYTKSLWLAEGWTSYYDNLFLVRAGLIDAEGFLELIEHELNDVMRSAGRFRQGLRESSFDTWIKFYKKDENSNNTQISYYTKGALVATMLNLEIMTSTGCRHSIDDVMKGLYADYQRDPSTGYTEERVKRLSEKICGKNLDTFWKKYIDGTAELPMKKCFAKFGIEMVNEAKGCSLDIETKDEAGKLTVAKVIEGGSAYGSGLCPGDEILGADGYRVNLELLNKYVESKKRGDKVEVLVARKGLIESVEVILKDPVPKYKLKLSPEAKAGKNKYLKKLLAG